MGSYGVIGQPPCEPSTARSICPTWALVSVSRPRRAGRVPPTAARPSYPSYPAAGRGRDHPGARLAPWRSSRGGSARPRARTVRRNCTA